MTKNGFLGCCAAFLAVGSLYGREAITVPGHAPSILPDGKEYKLVWSDEFDGTALDASKWSYRTNFWGRRASWFAGPEDGAVEVKDGCARLKIVKRADGSYCSPQLQTGELVWDGMIDQSTAAKGSGLKWPFPKRERAKFLHRFGYWECRFRLQEKPGWWSAFWMQSPDQGATVDPRRSGVEQDVLESFEPGRYIVHAFHYNGYGADYKRFNAQRAPYTPVPTGAFKVSYPLSLGEFHTCGLLWEPDGYTVYVDGVQSGNKVGGKGDEVVSQVEEFLLLTTEIKGFRKDNAPDPEAIGACAAGDAFVVDYVRVYDIVPAAARKIRIACIGDSITSGYAMTNSAAESYPVQLQKMLGDRYDVRNFAVGGTGAYAEPKAIPGVYCPIVWRKLYDARKAYAFKPDIVISNFGINDSGVYSREFLCGPDGKPTTEPGRFRKDYVALLEAFTTEAGGRPRFFIWTKLGPLGKMHPGKANLNSIVMRKDLEAVAVEVGAIGLDMYTPLLPYVETPHFAKDGVHPEGGAQRVIAEVTAAALKKVME